MVADGRRQPRAGRYLLTLSALGLVALALLFRSHAYALLAAVWLGLLLAARVETRRALAALGAGREVTTGAFEDDELAVHLELVNRGRRPRALVELSDHFGPSLQERRTVYQTGALPGRHRRRFTYEVICSRLWGIYQVGPLELKVSDGLGLSQARKRVGEARPFTLFPHVYHVAGLERLGARPSFTRQGYTTGRPGQSDLYLGVREYAVGDDPRRLHWPATARFGTPLVREFELDLARYMTLFLDLHRDHRSGLGRKSTVEFLVRVGASVVATAARAGQFVQLFSNRKPSLLLPPGRGEKHLELALHELVRVKQDATRALLDVVYDETPSLPLGSTAVLLLGTATPPPAALQVVLERLRARSVVTALVLIDRHSFLALDKLPPGEAEVAVQHAEVARLAGRFGARLALLDSAQELDQRLAHGLFER